MTFHQFKDQNYIPSLKGHPSVSRRGAYQLIHWCSSWWEPPLISQSWESWQFWSAVEVLPSKIKSWKTEVKRNWIFTRNDINFLSLSQISEATTCVNLLAFGWIYNTSMTLTISASDKYKYLDNLLHQTAVLTLTEVIGQVLELTMKVPRWGRKKAP